MTRFRYAKSCKAGYSHQAYVYGVSQSYNKLDREAQKLIQDICRKCAGDKWEALLEYATTRIQMDRCMDKHYIGSRSDLAEMYRRYVERFPRPRRL